MKWCVIYLGGEQIILGDTKEEIVNKIFRWRLEDRKLFQSTKFHAENQYISFKEEYTNAEMYRETINYLYEQLPSYGYQIFKNIQN